MKSNNLEELYSRIKNEGFNNLEELKELNDEEISK
jgi:hypothetical protein